MFIEKISNYGKERAQFAKPKSRTHEPNHSPVTQDTVVSQERINPTDPGVGGGKQFKAGNKTEAESIS